MLFSNEKGHRAFLKMGRLVLIFGGIHGSFHTDDQKNKVDNNQ